MQPDTHHPERCSSDVAAIDVRRSDKGGEHLAIGTTGRSLDVVISPKRPESRDLVPVRAGAAEHPEVLRRWTRSTRQGTGSWGKVSGRLGSRFGRKPGVGMVTSVPTAQDQGRAHAEGGNDADCE